MLETFSIIIYDIFLITMTICIVFIGLRQVKKLRAVPHKTYIGTVRATKASGVSYVEIFYNLYVDENGKRSMTTSEGRDSVEPTAVQAPALVEAWLNSQREIPLHYLMPLFDDEKGEV